MVSPWLLVFVVSVNERQQYFVGFDELQESADRPGIELKVPCDVIEYVKFGKIYRLCDVTINFELNFQAIGLPVPHEGSAFDFSS